MELKDLGYTQKWINYGLLTEEMLSKQYSEFQKGEDQNTEHYRYETFKHWLSRKNEFTDLEIKEYIELALEDMDSLMAGAAVKDLFTHSRISDAQFELIKDELIKFGDWSTKVIKREELKRRIENENLTEDLIENCINHRNTFNENSLIELMIHKLNNVRVIEKFTQSNFGQKIRNLAEEKIKRIKKTCS